MSARPNRLSDHAVDRYIERHGARHAEKPDVSSPRDREWVAKRLANACERAQMLRYVPGDLNGEGQWIWTLDFLGPLLLVVDKTGLVRTVLP